MRCYCKNQKNAPLISESLFEANLIGGVVDPLDSEQTDGEFYEGKI